MATGILSDSTEIAGESGGGRRVEGVDMAREKRQGANGAVDVQRARREGRNGSTWFGGGAQW